MTSDTNESARVEDARARAKDRTRRQREALRPLGLAVAAVVVVTTLTGDPAPGTGDKPLAVTLCLCAFVALLLLAIRPEVAARGLYAETTLIAALGGFGVALVALQPKRASAVGGAAAVWLAFATLPLRLALPLGIGVTASMDVVVLVAGGSPAAVAAATLLCALLAVVAYVVKEARASQDRTELLLAQLEDAREQQLEGAAIAERSRIAAELHDVLAHSLSGAAIQLQAARKLAELDEVRPQMRAAIERAGELVRDGLADARQAVGALRGDALPSVAQLESLVERFRANTDVDVTLEVQGVERALPADASLALFRGAQEALTNVARYAPGAAATIVLSYETGRTTLRVDDRVASPVLPALDGVGGGRGLAGLRERLEHAGGSMSAGPTASGWRVELEVPA